MPRRMSVREARARFADVLGSVYHTGEPVIVERNGKPVAVLISPDAFVSTTPPNAVTSEDELAALLEQAPTVRALFERSPRAAQDRPMREMIALAHEEAWASERTRSDG